MLPAPPHSPRPPPHEPPARLRPRPPRRFRTDEEVLVITPDFNYENDEGVEIGDAFWNNSRPWGDWRAGAHSSPKSGQYAALRLERLPGKGQIGTSDRRQAAAASAGCPADCPPSHPLRPPPNCRSRPAARVGQQAGRGMDMAPDPSLTRVRPLLASAQRPHGLVVRGARHLRQPALGDGALPQARCARTAPRPSRRRPCALSWRPRPIVAHAIQQGSSRTDQRLPERVELRLELVQRRLTCIHGVLHESRP